MVELEPVVLVQNDEGTQVGTPVVDGVRVAAVVVAHGKGAKIRVFKYKPKKRYRRTHGHRSALTELRIEAVLAAGEPMPKPKAAEPKAAKPATAAAAKPARSRTRAKAAVVEAPGEPAEETPAEAPEAPAAWSESPADAPEPTADASEPAAATPPAPRKRAPRPKKTPAADSGDDTSSET
jgi:ribosomal protein L21